MLEELDIRDLAIAEQLHLRFGAGFTAITGETGAGKSLIIDALGLLLGDRAGSDVVRSGARAAHIEGIFSLEGDGAATGELQALLEQTGIELEDGQLIISREIGATGRGSARINGRAIVHSTLASIGGRLVDIHSQTDHLSILRPAEHLNYLDRFAGTIEARQDLAELAGELRQARAELARLRGDARERARRLDQLAHEVEEIEAADLEVEEEDNLRAERGRLANAEQLVQLAGHAYAALEGEGRAAGAVDALGRAAALLDQLARIDARRAAEAAQLEALQSQAADLARGLRSYREEVEFQPERLQEIEERLSQIAALKRRYGDSIGEVLAYAARASRELETLSSGEEREAALSEREAELLTRLTEAARAVSRRRREAARCLSEAVEQELADLGLARGRFGVRFELHEAADGLPLDLPPSEIVAAAPELPLPAAPHARRCVAFDRSGADRVELLVSLNPGEPLRPLARVASGGETSRLMLALKTILGRADDVPTLVFDEVDTGVGSRSGRVVGEKLAQLATHHQVICITHLAPIASLAARHIGIVKEVTNDRTRVVARELAGEEREEELAAMLGGVTPATRASARELLASGNSAAGGIL